MKKDLELQPLLIKNDNQRHSYTLVDFFQFLCGIFFIISVCYEWNFFFDM